jgi:hypothetical protein
MDVVCAHPRVVCRTSAVLMGRMFACHPCCKRLCRHCHLPELCPWRAVVLCVVFQAICGWPESRGGPSPCGNLVGSAPLCVHSLGLWVWCSTHCSRSAKKTVRRRWRSSVWARRWLQASRVLSFVYVNRRTSFSVCQRL